MRVVYPRLAARELIDSALFYDRRRVGLGDGFLREVEVVLELSRQEPDAGLDLRLRAHFHAVIRVAVRAPWSCGWL